MRIHVGQGTEFQLLTVFPVWTNVSVAGRRGYATDAARLQLSELPDGLDGAGGPAVSRLLASNPGRLPVLVLDGQLFEGGWQHRMSVGSQVVAAGGRAEIEVACVEQARWGGGREQRSRGRRAPTMVRTGFDVGAQHEVWERVGRLAGDDVTLSLVGRMDADEQARPEIAAAWRPGLLTGQVGVLIGIGGQPLTLELFDHPATLREQFDAILRAAELDAEALEGLDGTWPLSTPGRRARRMVERIERGSSTVDVRRLEHRGRTLHLQATSLRHPLLAGAR